MRAAVVVSLLLTVSLGCVAVSRPLHILYDGTPSAGTAQIVAPGGRNMDQYPFDVVAVNGKAGPSDVFGWSSGWDRSFRAMLEAGRPYSFEIEYIPGLHSRSTGRTKAIVELTPEPDHVYEMVSAGSTNASRETVRRAWAVIIRDRGTGVVVAHAK